jgi:3' terminal RNA ribose 2'-O-methyltransferase Hen1
MLLTISTTHTPATDLGFLLHKNPARPQSVELSFGTAHVFYPEATQERCTAALLLEVDPVGLVRGRRGPAGEGGALEQYVNDRPYVASSFMSVAIARVYGSALSGKSGDRPDLVQREIPLRVKIAVLPCRGGETFLRKLFEPLGYVVEATGHPLDETIPGWESSKYFTVELSATKRLSDLLSHLYVLIPVLDGDKHYWVSDDEVQKLLRHGEGWLAAHPEREAIAHRYLKHQKSLARQALEQLLHEEITEVEEKELARNQEEHALEERISLNEQRIATVVSVLKEVGAKRVVDLGCGEGRLLKALLGEREFTEIVGLDVSFRALETAKDRLNWDRLPEMQRKRLSLLHGSLMYRDKRLSGFDAASIIEVIEHLDAARLSAFERVLFEFARPMVAIVTTPNAEFNVKFELLPAGKFRHKDHRFEWSRTEFQGWANGIGSRFGFSVRFLPVGAADPIVGPPTQMAVFSR